MPLPTSTLMRLYDEHAARLYAVALRIVGDRDVAADVLEEVFLSIDEKIDAAQLVGRIRQAAQARIPAPTVEVGREAPSPRMLIEEAFYRGCTVADLARRFSLTETAVRTMLREGMAELRTQAQRGATR